MVTGVRGRTVLIAGATSASGLAAARALIDAGAQVIAVGRDAAKLRALSAQGALSPERKSLRGPDTRPSEALRTEVCDLTDAADVARLAQRLHGYAGRIDGVLHLVGGWRGGGGLAGQSEADYRFLEQSFTALRHVSRAFDEDLRASDAGRLAIVSSTAVTRPLAGGANYAAVKAASEAWARAVAQGFTKAARDESAALAAASVIFRVKALEGLENQLADAYIGLFTRDAAEINDTVIDLTLN